MRPRLVVAGVLAAGLIAALALHLTRDHAPPAAPPTAATTVPAPAPPRPHRISPAVALRAPGAPRDLTPGAAALRRQTDDFVDSQADAVREHLARERLTLDETRELTYFAILAVASQDWGRVEALTGAPLSADARRQTWEAMMARSQEMRRHLQEQVAAGASEDARWETIGRIEDGYLSDYYRLTGMTPALLDQLLLASVREQRIDETIASVSPGNQGPPAPRGGAFVRRDPAHPERPPVPVDEPPPP